MVLVTNVLVVHVIHPVNVDKVEPGTRGGELTPGDLPPGPDVLHGADPQGPVEQPDPVQSEESEEIGEKTIPPPVEPYSVGQQNLGAVSNGRKHKMAQSYCGARGLRFSWVKA